MKRTKFKKMEQKLVRTKFPKVKRKLERTKFPLPKHKTPPDPFKHSPAIHTSKHLCKLLERIYAPPLSRSEIIEKRGLDQIRPDMSHMTRWSPR